MCKKVVLEKELENGDISCIDFGVKENKEQSHILVGLLNNVSELIACDDMKDDNASEKIMTSIEEFQENVLDLSQTSLFSKFLNEKYGSSKVMKLLKTVDQGFVLCTLGKLMQILREIEPPNFENEGELEEKNSKDRLCFKDVRGEWRVFIRKHNDEKNRFSVSHRRTEQMILLRGKRFLNIFQFSWELRIVFDSNEFLRIDEVHASLIPPEYQFDPTFKWSRDEEDFKKKVINWGEDIDSVGGIDKEWYGNMLMGVFGGASRTELAAGYFALLKKYESKLSFIENEMKFGEKDRDKYLECLVRNNGDMRSVMIELLKPVILATVDGNKRNKQEKDRLTLSKEEKDLILERRRLLSRPKSKKKLMKERKKKLKKMKREERKMRKEEKKISRKANKIKKAQEKARRSMSNQMLMVKGLADFEGIEEEGDTSSSLEDTSVEEEEEEEGESEEEEEEEEGEEIVGEESKEDREEEGKDVIVE